MSEIRPSSSSSGTSGSRRDNLAETNQFSAPAQGTEGIVTINLRGLGAGRTLTLINGRRQVATESNGVDVSAFPMSAFARTEILKDAAAVTYGSDAIAGVVNFISRTGFEGIEISGSNTWLDESNGNNTINVIGGMAGERWNGFLALEFDHRSELKFETRIGACARLRRTSTAAGRERGCPARRTCAIRTFRGGGTTPDPGNEPAAVPRHRPSMRCAGR